MSSHDESGSSSEAGEEAQAMLRERRKQMERLRAELAQLRMAAAEKLAGAPPLVEPALRFRIGFAR